MKTSFFLLFLLAFISCNNGNSNNYEIRLQPKDGDIKQYTAEDKFQLFIKTDEKELEVYTKHLYDYTVQYEVKDTVITGRITFENFRIEFEDGQGVQVFDTKFDKPDRRNLEIRFYFAMLRKQVTFNISPNGIIREVKGIKNLKVEILKAYEAEGITGNELTILVDKILENFVANRLLQENYFFYTRKPVVNDSGYNIRFTAKTPLTYQMENKYMIRSQTEKEVVLAGRGTATVSDSSRKDYPFSLLQSNQLNAEALDEVRLEQATGILQYRKFYFNISDSMLVENKKLPVRLIVEKEIRLKKTE